MMEETLSAETILDQLRPLGSESYKKVLLNHGVAEPVWGVKIEQLKKFQKRIKKNYALSLDLYATGVYDAMYLAGLVADEAKMTKQDLRRWLKQAHSDTLCGYTVPWVAAESRFGRELAIEWIASKQEGVAAAGWATLSGLVAIKDDADLDLDELKQLLDRVGNTIHQQPDRVRYQMNGFVIAVGAYVSGLTGRALEVAQQIGPVAVDMGKTACKVPSATQSIEKIQQRGGIGKKRKTVRC